MSSSDGSPFKIKQNTHIKKKGNYLTIKIVGGCLYMYAQLKMIENIK